MLFNVNLKPFVSLAGLLLFGLGAAVPVVSAQIPAAINTGVNNGVNTGVDGEVKKVAKITPISPQALLDMQAKKTELLLLDVRNQDEFARGHVPQAVLAPAPEFDKHIAKYSHWKEKPVVVYCERGSRAAHCERMLLKAGFRNIRHLTGDMIAWRKNASLPTAKPAPTSPEKQVAP